MNLAKNYLLVCNVLIDFVPYLRLSFRQGWTGRGYIVVIPYIIYNYHNILKMVQSFGI